MHDDDDNDASSLAGRKTSLKAHARACMLVSLHIRSAQINAKNVAVATVYVVAGSPELQRCDYYLKLVCLWWQWWSRCVPAYYT